MKVSEAWLREWANPDADTDTLIEQLTMAGLEVDGVEPVAGDFSGVCVAEIVRAEQHPNADKLRLCQVDIGTGEQAAIICGAPNARAGIKVACAKIGAVLPGNFKIKKAKLRGVESFGMLCSASELQLSEESEGIIELPADAPVGADLRDYLALDDKIIDIDLTPNRGDCFSVLGVAREMGVINRVPLKPLSAAPVQPTIDDKFEVALKAPDACPKFLGRVIKGIKAHVTSPLWLVEKLRRSGIRAIHPVVDVTNFVLMELGQPMHAYDLPKLDGSMHVRLAQDKESLVLLDGQEVTLTPDTLVIADDKKAVALAGIMGGLETGVVDDTTDIFLECAFFSPLAIAGRARQYGLHTDGSMRFERGVDFQLQAVAIEMATRLIVSIVGGEAGPVVATVDESCLPQSREVTLRAERIKRLIGIDFEPQEVTDILTRLGMTVEAGEGVWTVQVPGYRFDISQEVDLIEELVRIYGYNNLPVATPTAAMTTTPVAEKQIKTRRFIQCLVERGYQEVITYSFVEPSFQQRLNPGIEALPLLNPISQELSVMRTSLWPGLVKSAIHNLNRQQKRLLMFEHGLTFVRTNGVLEQHTFIAGLVTGPKSPVHWSMDQKPFDFFDVKGHVEALLALQEGTGALHFESTKHDALHPGQSAQIIKAGKKIGCIGALHPSVAKALGIDQPVFLFELALVPISEAKLPKYEDFSKYPANRRDIAVLVNSDVSAYQLQECAFQAGGDLLREVRIFDVYQGQDMKKDTKSIALGLTIRDTSRTLKDSDVSQIIDKVVVSLKETFNATLRE